MQKFDEQCHQSYKISHDKIFTYYNFSFDLDYIYALNEHDQKLYRILPAQCRNDCKVPQSLAKAILKEILAKFGAEMKNEEECLQEIHVPEMEECDCEGKRRDLEGYVGRLLMLLTSVLGIRGYLVQFERVKDMVEKRNSECLGEKFIYFVISQICVLLINQINGTLRRKILDIHPEMEGDLVCWNSYECPVDFDRVRRIIYEVSYFNANYLKDEEKPVCPDIINCIATGDQSDYLKTVENFMLESAEGSSSRAIPLVGDESIISIWCQAYILSIIYECVPF